MQFPTRLALVAFAGAVAVSAASCSSCSRQSGTQAAREDIGLVPKQTDVVGAINVTRMRDTAVWRKLLDLRDTAIADHKKALAEKKDEPEDKDDSGAPKDYQDFVTRCGFDPFTQLDSLFFALPGHDGEGEFALIARGRFDQNSLIACAKALAKKQGSSLDETEHDGKKLYNDAAGGAMFVSFLDDKTLILGGKEWSKKVLDLATGKGETKESAKDNPELVALVKKARTSDALWGVGVVGDNVRDRLKDNEKLAAAGSMKDLYGSIDFASGMTLQVTVDLGSDADAQSVAKGIAEQLTDLKKNAQVMILGMASYIDAIKVEAQGSTFKASMKNNQQQVEDLISRLQGAAKGIVGASRLGPGGLGGMGGFTP